MNRIKLTAISTLTTAMILGSAVVFAAAPADDTSSATIDEPSVQAEQPSVQTEVARRSGGGAGHALKK